MIINENEINEEQHEKAHAIAEGIFQALMDELNAGQEYTPGAFLLAFEMLTVVMRGFVVHYMSVQFQELTRATLMASSCSNRLKDLVTENSELILSYQKKLEEEMQRATPNVPGGEA